MKTTGVLLILAISGGMAVSVQGQVLDGARLTTPEWMRVDRSAHSVSLEITAAQTGSNNGWNLNGHAHGEVAIVVPAGYEIFIVFRNADRRRPHVISIGSPPGDGQDVLEPGGRPAHDGPGSMSNRMAGATGPGETDLVALRADRPGEYAIKCAVPGHQDAGMWLRLEVSEQGAAGLTVR